MVVDWRAIDEPSLSDHNYIRFTIIVSGLEDKRVRIPKENGLGSLLVNSQEQALQRLLGSIRTPEDMEIAASITIFRMPWLNLTRPVVHWSRLNQESGDCVGTHTLSSIACKRVRPLTVLDCLDPL